VQLMNPHPATLWFLERLGELVKGIGSALTEYAKRLKSEPIK